MKRENELEMYTFGKEMAKVSLSAGDMIVYLAKLESQLQ